MILLSLEKHKSLTEQHQVNSEVFVTPRDLVDLLYNKNSQCTTEERDLHDFPL